MSKIYLDKEKGEEFASGSAQIFALCRFILPKFKKGVCLSRRFRAQPESGDAACRVRQLCRRLVYDKLTPNCHSKILYGKRQSLLKCCLYVCMKFCGMSNSAVQGIVSLSYACFPTVDFASADAEFGAHFGLPHAVHIAIQDGEFQSG